MKKAVIIGEAMGQKPFRLAVRALIKDEQDRCLLLRRSSVCKGFVGKWEWPGGKADEGETFDVALKREVREETGLEIELVGVVGAFGFDMADKYMATLCMEARLVGGKLQLSEEHDAYEWAPVVDVPKWDMTDGLKEIAVSYTATLKKK